jgi:hypothetical protein
MRTIFIAASLLSASFMKFCDKSEDKSPASSAQLETDRANTGGDLKAAPEAEANARARADMKASAAPSIGGSFVALGAYRAELALHEQGLVEARLTMTNGAPAADVEKMKLAVTASTKTSGRERIQLVWEPARQRFAGRASARAELAPGPVDIELDVADKLARANLTGAAVLGAPEFGGSVLAAGDYAVELAARASGDVEAHVKNAAGAALDGSAGLSLTSTLQANGGAAQAVSLNWDPAAAAFKGRAAAGVQLLPGPAEIQLSAGGPAYVGGLAQLSIAGAASHGGRVVVAGDYSLELAQKEGVLLAYVMDASGKALAASNLDVSLRLGGAAAAVTRLTWDAPSAAYTAKVAAKFDLTAQPVRVEIKIGGRSHVGAFGRLDARAKANSNLNAALESNARGDAKLAAKVPRPKVDADLKKSVSAKAGVKAALPKVSVSAPKVSASAGTSKAGNANASAKAGFSFGTK